MSPIDEQAEIDARIQVYYGEAFDEAARLTAPGSHGTLELQRTLEIIRAHVPAGGHFIDIGGGPGVLARGLLDEGRSVELIDPVPSHIEHAAGLGVSARIGDARDLPFDDAAFDAALLLGPLYHLGDRETRLHALREARRVTRPGGVVLAGAITRFVRFAALHLAAEAPSQPSPALVALLADGTPPPQLRFPAGHFHTAEELRLELEDAGLRVLGIHGVEGPGGNLLAAAADPSPDVVEAALVLARRASEVPAVRELSSHLLAVGRVPPAG